LTFPGLSKFGPIAVLRLLMSFNLGDGGSVVVQFVALAITMVLAIFLGMGMPAVPAYLNVALLMGPLLIGLGIATFTAHMFIFYFAIASAITPPVAMAAFAASTITRADPMMTGFSAMRSGIVMFAIPFVFAFYPEILLIDQALIDPASPTGAPLAGYENGVSLGALFWLIARLILALYLVASALAGFDAARLTFSWILIRLAAAVAVLMRPEMVQFGALVFVALLLGWHHMGARRQKTIAS
jgi:TRAP-type uncharacterized transport system fused permease subunit